MNTINKDITLLLLHYLRNISLKFPLTKYIFLKTENVSYDRIIYSNIKEEIKNKISQNIRIFKTISKTLEKYEKDFNFKNKIILEIGPGKSLLLAIIFIINGAKAVYLVDRYRQILDNEFNLKLYEGFLKFYTKKGIFPNELDLQSIKKKIHYYGSKSFESFDKIKFGSIDLIFSNAVLEHTYDVNLVIINIYKLLKKEGYSYHYIDLRDHFHIRDKCYLNFLKYPSRYWNFIGDTNRMRFSQYIKLFNKYDFKILELKCNKAGPLSEIIRIKKGLHRNFQHLDPNELSIVEFSILAKKFK